MRGNRFIIVCGIIFYLFVTLNYPFLDLLISQAKASNLLFYNPDELKCEDLLLDMTIKTHNWSVPTVKPTSDSNINHSKPVQRTLSVQRESAVIYVVKQGDVLWKIAKKYGVDISTICRLNNLKTTTLKIGQKLKIKEDGSFLSFSL